MRPEYVLLEDGPKVHEAQLQAIADATNSIDLIVYAWAGGALGGRYQQILADKAQRGLRVRLMVDALGSRHFNPASISIIRAAGVEVSCFNPFTWRPNRWWSLNRRCHHKLLVIDGRVAFLGGVNICDDYLHPVPLDSVANRAWHDLQVLIRSEQSECLQGVCDNYWAGHHQKSSVERYANDLVVSSCGQHLWRAHRSENPIYVELLRQIQAANHRIWILHCFFLPPTELTRALCQAAQRGVDVRIMIPRQNRRNRLAWISRLMLSPVLRAGGLGFIYQPTALHAKAILIDDDQVMIGSCNLDDRSLLYNDELALFARHDDLSSSLASVFKKDEGRSQRLSGQSLPLWRLWMQGVLRRCLLLVRPLL